MSLVSFGGMVSEDSSQSTPSWESNIAEAISAGQYLPVGMGRSYGDVGLVSGNTAVSSLGLNRLLAFNNETGVLTVEPGVLLRDIQEIFVKRGWMLPVTPGTAYVSVGGAVANDVHGKDHHFAGTFGEHVLSLTLVRSSGEVLFCTPQENSGMLRATIGGLGLTGFITQVSMQLKRVAGPYFDAEAIAFSSLGEFFQISTETEDENWQASVAWFDCSTRKAGRGSFTRGNVSKRPYDSASEAKEGTLAVPFTPPISLINKASLDLFNTAYFHLQKSGSGTKHMHYREFYYPLDGVQHWNRIYGPRGFFQYQSVVPMNVAAEATEEMLSVIRKSRQGSFLAVLKTFANREPAGLLSFARHGVTLALDFPNRGEKTEALMQQLDRIVLDAGGTLNPSKDARMSRELFAAGYPNLQEFKKYRDPNAVSDFSRRVFD